jgi:PKD repeat protein
VQNPSHTFTSPGTYTVTLTATNNAGNDAEEKTGFITVTSGTVAPVAAFSASPISGTAPLSVQFTDQSTNTPTSWSWTFGDGNTSAVRNPSHTFTSPGSYTVTLTATNSEGSNSEEKTGYITITSGTVAPVAAFTASPTSGTAPLSVQFTDQSTNTPTSWSWTFGDGGTSAVQNPLHTFTSPGTYTVTLTATNSAGNDTEERTGYITVSGSQPDSLHADFSATHLEGFPPLLVRFTDLSSGTITSRAWDFLDDGTIDSREKDPFTLYKKPGVYTVRLEVTGPDGTDSEIKEAYITVKEGTPLPAIARFTQDKRKGNSPLTVTFTDRSFNSPDTYTWSFGDGTTSPEKDPEHTYTSPGIYHVTLKVSNEYGGSSAQGYVLVWEREESRLNPRGLE